MAAADRSFDEVARTIGRIQVAMMTTTEDDGTLSSRPMATVRVDDDGSLWFLTSAGSHLLEHLARMNLACADTADADYLSITGAGELVSDRATVAGLWSEQARPWFPAGPDDPSLVALRVRPERIDYWGAPSSRMVRTLQRARAAATGSQAPAAEHGRIEPPAGSRGGRD
jgi:general stress protein 26